MGALTIRPGIDPVILARWAQRDPFRHAFAAYDLVHAPQWSRFFSLWEGGEAVGYLLEWRGEPRYPVFHWVGPQAPPDKLREWLPAGPWIAIIPPELEAPLRAAFPAVRTYPLLGLIHPPTTSRMEPVPELPPGFEVRRLSPGDRPGVEALVRQFPGETVLSAYLRPDLALQRILGVLAPRPSGEIVALGRTSAETAECWILGGLFTHPAHRRKGLGRAITAALLEEASGAGASLGLFVRADNEPARELYRSLGFTPAEPRVWADLGTGSAP